MVKIGMWQEQNLFLIHIRDFKLGYNGMHLPEQKGIALTLSVWRQLFSNINHINEDVEELAKKYKIEEYAYGDDFNPN